MIMNDFERGYIVGLIEGEGSITLNVCGRKGKNGTSITINPKVTINNTCKELIDKANIILNGAIYMQRRYNKTHERKKPAYRIEVWSLEKVKALLEEMLNDFVCKHRQAELVIEYCKIRLDKIEKSKDKIHGCCIWGSYYGEREFEILKEIRLLNVPKSGYHSPDYYTTIEQKVRDFKEGYNARINRMKIVEKKCSFCGKIFKIKLSRLKDNKRQKTGTYCSTRCRGYALRVRQLGITVEEASKMD